MPPAAWKPPAETEKYLEYSADRQQEGTGKIGKWMQAKTSLKGHLRNEQHLARVRNFETHLATAADKDIELSAAYDAPAVNHHPQIHVEAGARVPDMIPDVDIPMDIDFDHISVIQMAEQLGESLDPEPQKMLRILTTALEAEHFPDSEEDEDLDLQNNDNQAEEEVGFDMNAAEDSEYYPYPDKTTMLLDILDNLPRACFTGAQLSLVIHFAKSLGAPNVPSLKGLRRIQKDLQLRCGHEPVKIDSAMGNVFYMNDLRESIARDFSNPLVAPHMQLYPEEANGSISENWQSERHWNMTDAEITIDAHELQNDFKDVTAQFGKRLVWTETSKPLEMPNKMRDLVGNNEGLFVVMVSPWSDDVSGNKSKQYNKHINVYAQNSCLPGRLLQQEFHMHYVSTSPHASSAEQFAALRDHIKETESTPIRAYNAATQRPCRIILRAPSLPADNPQQSEEASHMGGNANHPCRKCHWGGTQKEKESPHLYHDCHLPGIVQNATEIRQELQMQLDLVAEGKMKQIGERQTASGTKDKVTQYWIEKLIQRGAEIRKANPSRSVRDVTQELRAWLTVQPGDKMNPLLDLAGLDPSQDTPVELLHTVLLGVIKYIWHFMNTFPGQYESYRQGSLRLSGTKLKHQNTPGALVIPHSLTASGASVSM
ncbi:hypothetical protein GGX14DRAFT_392616 [Mycena pura]|uniref:Uncharacterized protein n=1 Tax=Mycena pura TaxID=153505 RepID=A0AAD6VQV2_9AGAR|nr:hypothetical protein GGX14DRAFT_392616 [Mycena pura]